MSKCWDMRATLGRVLLPNIKPMPLGRSAQPFSHPDWLFEIKWDGFRSLAIVEAGECSLVSRNGNPFNWFRELARYPARTEGPCCSGRGDRLRRFAGLTPRKAAAKGQVKHKDAALVDTQLQSDARGLSVVALAHISAASPVRFA
jgi:hypothetical protein